MILSRTEGQCKASVEYLLCGLPVVSTPSTGGRDEFFDPDYVAIVEPTAEAVRKGVEDVIGRGLLVQDIRQRTLDRISSHRGRFCDELNRILQSDGQVPRTEDEWFSGWRNKAKQVRSIEDFAVQFRSEI